MRPFRKLGMNDAGRSGPAIRAEVFEEMKHVFNMMENVYYIDTAGWNLTLQH